MTLVHFWRGVRLKIRVSPVLLQNFNNKKEDTFYYHIISVIAINILKDQKTSHR